MILPGISELQKGRQQFELGREVFVNSIVVIINLNIIVTFFVSVPEVPRLSAESILSGDTAHTSTGKKTCAQS